MYVLDAANGRMSILAPDYRFLENVPLRLYPRNAVLTATGKLVILGSVATADRAGLPLHLVDTRTGEIRRSFGAVAPELSPRKPLADVRRATPGAGDDVWIAYPNRYRLERWALDGTLRETIERTTAWFAPWDEQVKSYLVERPKPILLDIQFDQSSQLMWVMLQVADPRWRPRREQFRAGTQPSIADREAEFDAVIEVLDAGTHKLLARRQFDRLFEGFVGAGLAVSSREDADGFPFSEVWRISLKR